MKTRRSLQVIVGVVSLITVACILGAAACAVLEMLFPNMSQTVSTVVDTLTNGFKVVAAYLGFANVWYILPILVYALPAALLLTATILLFWRDNGKQGKYVAGSVLALIAVAILSIFHLLFASDLTSFMQEHVWSHTPFEWTSMDTIVRYVAAGLLAIFIIFIGSALGVKPKKTSEVATEEQSEEPLEATNRPTYETVNPSEQQTDTVGEATEYVPTEASVSDVSNGVYGRGEQSDEALMAKINKARMLYDMGAITQEEYLKLVTSYAKK